MKPGETAAITVSVTGTANVAALQIFVPTLPGMTMLSGPALPAGKAPFCGTGVVAPLAGLYGCIFEGGQGALSDGVLATINFPAPSASMPIPLSNLRATNAAGDPAVTAASGPLLTLSVTSVVKNACDVNGDGTVNAADVIIAKAQVLGLVNSTLDLTGSGKVSVVDVQRVENAITGTCRVGQ